MSNGLSKSNILFKPKQLSLNHLKKKEEKEILSGTRNKTKKNFKLSIDKTEIHHVNAFKF